MREQKEAGMKREATNHTKLKKLGRRLNIPHYAAVGIMELVWHLCARETPRGDIGRLANEDIAQAVDWRCDENLLVAELVNARLLDASDEHRLIVHDWPDHADQAVHAKVARARQFFANGQAPRLYGCLYKTERAELEAFYASRGVIPATNRNGSATSSQKTESPSDSENSNIGLSAISSHDVATSRMGGCYTGPEPMPEPINPLTPFSDLPDLADTFDDLINATDSWHHSRRKAQVTAGPDALLDAQRALAMLVTADGYSEADVCACIRWLIDSQDRDAVFWRGNIWTVAELRSPKQAKAGEPYKFAKIFDRWRKATGDGEPDDEELSDYQRDVIRRTEAKRKGAAHANASHDAA